MDQIIVNKPAGQSYRLFQYNKVSGVIQAEQSCALSGEDIVTMSVVSARPLPFEINDWIDIFGRIYRLNALPNVNKVNDRKFEYDIKFEGLQYDMIKVQYLDIDSAGFSTGTTFSLMGNAETFLTLIVANLQRVYGEFKWALGDFPVDTDYQNVDFQGETCLQVLQKICDLYETNFDIERLPSGNFRLHVRKPQVTMEDTFIYGRGRGLYSLQRLNANEKNIVTRLFAFGAAKNLPLDYRNGSLRLKMPAGVIFSEGQPYIQDNQAVAKYGIIEGTINYDNIYPNRTGSVTDVNPANVLEFFDSTMPFNLTEVVNGSTTYLIDGMTAKVVFKTGNLAGYEFTLNANSQGNGYVHAQKKFTINTYTDDGGNVYPSSAQAAFQIQLGDLYTIVDITLPQAYIDAAEELLEETAGQYLFDNSKPRVQYGLNIEENYVAGMAPSTNVIINYFTVGHYLKVRDADLGIDGTSQIQAFKRNVLKHYVYDLTLGDEETNSTARIYRSKRRKMILAASSATALSASSYQAISQIAWSVTTQTISQNFSLTQVGTAKIFIGEGAVPEGYTQLALPDPDVDPFLTIYIPDLVGKSIQGMIFVDNSPIEYQDAGMDFDPAAGSLTLLPLGEVYDGTKIIVNWKS